MSVIQHAVQAATMKSWPAEQAANGDVRLEIPTQAGRTQVVSISLAQDGDGDAAAFVWSKAADLQAIQDPWAMLQLNTRLTYGRVAVRGTEVLVMHALHDSSADLAEVGKTIYWVAKAADDIEQQTYGAYVDVL